MLHAVDEVRTRVVRALDEYIELSDRMRGFEAAFGAHVLHTAAQLNETITHRRRLEAEYERIRAKLARGGYASTAEVEDDVRSALVTTETEHPDAGADGEPPSVPPSVPVPAASEAPDEELDDATKERIVRDFKRIVLPNVHADTSDAPYATFDVAYSAYKGRDYTLMEAFVIRFRPLTAEQAPGLLSQYQAAEARLERRLRTLRREATYDELNDPEAARQRMRRQSEEFRRAIDDEAERLADVRGRLRDLLRHAHERHLDGVS